MQIITELAEAFRDGVLNASSRAAKVRRWVALIAAITVAVGCVAMSVFAFVIGLPVPALTFAINAITFLLISATTILNASAAEAHVRAQKRLRDSFQIIINTHSKGNS